MTQRKSKYMDALLVGFDAEAFNHLMDCLLACAATPECWEVFRQTFGDVPLSELFYFKTTSKDDLTYCVTLEPINSLRDFLAFPEITEPKDTERNYP